MKMRIIIGVGVSVLLTGLSFVNRAEADTAFRVECLAPGDNDLFLLDPQVFSLPDQKDEFRDYIDLCLSVQGHPRVQGAFFR
ncbi:MAG TPA: hypothetical protein VGF24_05760 [Vicinamibacterales bacterium]|jgi:hypothetical protein